MTRKLTLALDTTIVHRAKKYAFQRKVSLSRLVESYFAALTSPEKQTKEELMPMTASLSGMINAKNIQDKNTTADYLIKKYL